MSASQLNISPHLSFASIALESHAWHSLEQTPISKSQTASRDKIGHRRRCSHGPISPFRLLVPYQHPSPRPLSFLLEGCPARLTPDSRPWRDILANAYFCSSDLERGGHLSLSTQGPKPELGCETWGTGKGGTPSPRWNPCCPPSLSHPVTIHSPAATWNGTRIKPSPPFSPPPSPGSPRYVILSRSVPWGRKIERAERSSGSHQVARARERPHALTPSSALPSLYIKCNAPSMTPSPFPTSFRPKPSQRTVAMVNHHRESTSQACLGDNHSSPTRPRPTSIAHHTTHPTPTPPHNLQGRQPTAFPPPTSLTRRPLRRRMRVPPKSHESQPGHPRFRAPFHHARTVPRIDSRSTLAQVAFAKVTPLASHPHPQAQLPELTRLGSAVGSGENDQTA